MRSLPRVTSSSDSVSHLNFISPLVNSRAVATEDVYFATESGKILEINFTKNAFFRESTLFSLLVKAPQSYARINRVR